MKRICCILLSLMIATACCFGQMDERFYHPDKEWVGIAWDSYSELYLPVQGDTVHAVLLKPHEPVKATILYLHGNGSNISKWVNHIKLLPENGYQVCLLDYRGFGKSTGKPTHMNIAHDAQVMLDTLLQLPEVKGTKLIIYGVSIGTQVATHLTKNNSDKVTALILDGMMASFTDVALATSPPEYHDMIRTYVTSPYSAKEDIAELGRVKLLVIHSNEDVIPISGAREVYEKATCAKTFWLYEGEHVEAPVKYPDTFVKYVDELLK